LAQGQQGLPDDVLANPLGESSMLRILIFVVAQSLASLSRPAMLL